MNEIGGYLELDTYGLPMYHNSAIALNCGRNCLAYLIETKKIKKIYLPYLLCNSVKEVCKKYNIEINYYHIKADFTPEELDLKEDEWLYVVNYYGQIKRLFLEKMINKYKRVIVDQAQAYFEDPIENGHTLYTCRKFFGVPDGAFLYTDSILKRTLPIDVSNKRMKFLLGRFEESASKYYSEYVANNEFFVNEPIKLMSKLTKNLLHGIDYERVKEKRTMNSAYLHKYLGDVNQLDVSVVDGMFMYPLLIKNADAIRNKLIQDTIYIPLLWPNVLKDTNEKSLEYRYAKDILPLPCDQRYSSDEMKWLVRKVIECIV